jgi:hypothetical protein
MHAALVLHEPRAMPGSKWNRNPVSMNDSVLLACMKLLIVGLLTVDQQQCNRTNTTTQRKLTQPDPVALHCCFTAKAATKQECKVFILQEMLRKLYYWLKAVIFVLLPI